MKQIMSNQFSLKRTARLLIIALGMTIAFFTLSVIGKGFLVLAADVSPTPSVYPVPSRTPPAYFGKHLGELTEQEMAGAIRIMECELQRLAGERAKQSVKPFDTDLSYGARGGRVKDLQLVLIATGNLGYGLDTGFFGVKTREALSKYQTERNITPSLGYFGVVTRASVNSFLEDSSPHPLCW